ncbi:alpha-galactosidase [Sphingopyxis sp. C-1]|uniref:alpha-galactosidase n=1 Tax=Sphingopyxis sp. C-1 TaxID=262667 RepID=UPI00187CE220|nr:alpha-galactosidase [Sphingopyxis sp. C-1]
MSYLPPAVRLDRSAQSMIFDLRRGAAELVWLGEPLPADQDLLVFCNSARQARRPSQPDEPAPFSILPQTGRGYSTTPAVGLMRRGTLLPLHLRLVEVAQSPASLRFIHRDEANGIGIDVSWRVLNSGVIEAGVRLTNFGSEPVDVLGLASLALPLPSWASHATRYSGRWAAEMQQTRVRLADGGIASASYGGRPGFGGGNWIRIESADMGEDHGHAIAAHLAWSGDHWLSVECNADGRAMLMMGGRLDPGEIKVSPGQSWESPRALFAVSSQGAMASRHAFHRHANTETLPDSSRRTPRKVHLNSWEALGFAMDLPKLTALADAAAAIGVERFVVDDGWFKGRRDDRTSLGDWMADPDVFPAGLKPLTDHVRALGLDFGLWVEPEMVSPTSDLYRRCPDWCIHISGQDRPTQRNQLVLDLTKVEVSDYVYKCLDTLLSENEISYLKWDHNRELFPLAEKGHAQVLALYGLLDRVRAAHPDVEIETCASGGGRVDYEILRRCARYWASDNNDAIERLRINSGWFDFMPLGATGNHVGPNPNPITGRCLPMDFRAKVAMFGHMGVEADPASMSASDRALLAAHITLYKEWRDVIHRGSLTRIAENLPSAFGYLALSGARGLALVAQTKFADHYSSPPVKMRGLDPAASYRISLLLPGTPRSDGRVAQTELWHSGTVKTGLELLRAGILLPDSGPETAWLISLERVA